MKHFAVIYLDIAFITAFYEETKGITVPIRVIKSRDVTGGVGVYGIVSVGATMREQKEYPLDSRAMFDELQSPLEAFPKIDLTQTTDPELPEMFWLDGVFGMSKSAMSENDQRTAWSQNYQFIPSMVRNDRTLNLVVNDAYFSSGYDQIYQHGLVLTCDFAIRVRLLVRLLYFDDHYAVAAPMLIIKQGNARLVQRS